MMEGKPARTTNVSVQPCSAAVYAVGKIPAVAPAEINLEINLWCGQSVPVHTASPSKKCTPLLPRRSAHRFSLEEVHTASPSKKCTPLLPLNRVISPSL